jgi:hypothetical protein
MAALGMVFFTIALARMSAGGGIMMIGLGGGLALTGNKA